MKDKIKHLLARTLVAKAFAKKAPILGAIIASEDVLKKLHAAGNDFLNGHPEGAKNELQQAITHAVGAGVNFLGGVSVIGMTSGLIAQTMAQRHAEQIAAQKPTHSANLDDGLYGSVVKNARRAAKTAQAMKTVLEVASSAAGDVAARKLAKGNAAKAGTATPAKDRGASASQRVVANAATVASVAGAAAASVASAAKARLAKAAGGVGSKPVSATPTAKPVQPARSADAVDEVTPAGRKTGAGKPAKASAGRVVASKRSTPVAGNNAEKPASRATTRATRATTAATTKAAAKPASKTTAAKTVNTTAAAKPAARSRKKSEA